MILSDEHAQVSDFREFKFALGWVEIEIILFKIMKDFARYFAMFLDCFNVDQNIV
jgi:hypothetical protein